MADAATLTNRPVNPVNRPDIRNNVNPNVARLIRARKKTASESRTPEYRRRQRASGSMTERPHHFSETEDIPPEYYNYSDLEEPFESSDEEDDNRTRRTSKPKFSLPLPRRRIRTLSGTVPITGYSPVWGGPTMCLDCMEFFDLPKDIDAFAQHLLTEHKTVISDIALIVDLKRYIEHWRGRFKEKPISDIFPKVEPAEGDPQKGVVEFYYLMSEKVPEDRKIRERLALRRLEEVLSCQQREREDRTFDRQCLFCRYKEEVLSCQQREREDRTFDRQCLFCRYKEEVLSCQQREREDRTFDRQCLFCRYKVRGNRSKLIHHLYTIHHLNLGSPDNLVFVNEYLDILKYRLDSNQCLYCEKFFPDHNTLMDHMRKKQHREVNPKNSYYDKFYVINYLIATRHCTRSHARLAPIKNEDLRSTTSASTLGYSCTNGLFQELGKKWLDVLAEDFEDSMPAFADSEDEEEEETWEEWHEDNFDENSVSLMCLFCDHFADDAQLLLKHITEDHSLDLVGFMKEQKLTFYYRVKLVNFIRKMSHNRICFACGKADLGSWQALRKHLCDGDHLTKIPPQEKWMSDEADMGRGRLFGSTCDRDHLTKIPPQEKWMSDEFLIPYFENDYLLCALDDIMDPEKAKAELKAEDVNGELTSTPPPNAGAGDDGDGSCRPPVVIPEDPPEMGDALSDPLLREGLM